MSEKKIFSQLKKAQQEFKDLKKDAVNPFFKSKYASLSSVLDSVMEPLNKNGLSLTQTIKDNAIVTIIANEEGETIESSYPYVIPKKVVEVGKGNFVYENETDPQVLGKVTTYARRYGLQLALGLVAEDDDANSVSRPAQQTKPATQTAAKPATQTAAKPASTPAPAASGKTLDDIKSVDGVVVTESEDSITVSGKTYSLSNDLKALGFIWVGTEKIWMKKVEKAA
jgi:hypothetical protein